MAPQGPASTTLPLRRRERVELLSLVMPIYNEAQIVPRLRQCITEFAASLSCALEVVLVNDGSSDGTLAALYEWAQADPRVRIVALARNFGHQAASTAGLDLARGDAVVLMDADLQDPLETVHEMIAKYLEGYDVVYGQRRARAGETRFKVWSAWAFYRLLALLASSDFPADTGDFRLISRRCLEAMKSLREQHRFLRGMCSWVGFAQTGVLYDRRARAAGETKFPLRKMMRFAFDAIFSFSQVPLRLSLYLGLSIAALGLGYSVYGIFRFLMWGDNVRGWTSLFILLALTNGAVLISNGIMGEYLGRVFAQVKNRPLYVVADTFCSAPVPGQSLPGPQDSFADQPHPPGSPA